MAPAFGLPEHPKKYPTCDRGSTRKNAIASPTTASTNADYLRFAAAFAYDPLTGDLRRRLAGGRISDRPAGSVGGKGYRRVMLDNVEHYAHRVAWLLQHGSWPKGQIDHKNRDRADNRLVNLRIADSGQNTRNRATSRSNSGVRGVYFYKRTKQWVARVVVDGKEHHLGYFDDLASAARARQEAASRLHGAFAADAVPSLILPTPAAQVTA